jgi:hypothetical protein
MSKTKIINFYLVKQLRILGILLTGLGLVCYFLNILLLRKNPNSLKVFNTKIEKIGLAFTLTENKYPKIANALKRV